MVLFWGFFSFFSFSWELAGGVYLFNSSYMLISQVISLIFSCWGSTAVVVYLSYVAFLLFSQVISFIFSCWGIPAVVVYLSYASFWLFSQVIPLIGGPQRQEFTYLMLLICSFPRQFLPRVLPVLVVYVLFSSETAVDSVDALTVTCLPIKVSIAKINTNKRFCTFITSSTQ